MIAIRSAAESHTGYVRTNNEDLAVISSDLAAIADGMGGHLGGEVAARTAIEELVEAFQRDRTAAGLVAAVRKANRAIWRKSRVERKLHGMGTTLTAAALLQGEGAQAPARLALVNVGDSRAYKIDRSDREHAQLSRLTEDHSVVEEMVRQGELTPAEAAMHPHRHVLTRALGIDSEVDVDVWDLDPVPGTRYLLCSDGLSDEVPEDEIARVLASSDDPHDAAKELVGVALGHGGIDNVTVVVVDVVEAELGEVEQPLEMVPARLPLPDEGDDRFSPDITQALPITRSRRRHAHGMALARTDDGAAAGSAAAAAAAAAAGAAAPEAETAPEVQTGADTDADDALSPSEQETQALAPSSALFDAEAEAEAEADGPSQADEGEPGDEPGHEPVEADTDATPAVSGNGRRVGRRSMTVRALPSAAALLASSGETTGLRPHATVLVPTSGFSRQYKDRVVTFRVFIFLVLLAALVAGMVAVVIWFQRSSYFVGLSGDRVSIYSGRPNGSLWFKPQLVSTTSLTTNELLPNSVVEVRRGITESSYGAARQEVALLIRLSSALGLYTNHGSATTPATSSTTTSTAAAGG